MVMTPSSSLSCEAARLTYLQRDGVFAAMPTAVLERLARASRLRSHSARSLIHARGDAPDGMYAVVRGGVRVTSSDAEGREALLAVLGEGSWFGETSLFDGLPRCYNASAQWDTDLLFLPRDAVERLLTEQPVLYRSFVLLLTRRIRYSIRVMEHAVLLGSAERLASQLLLMSDQAPDAEGQLRISQEDLSFMLGISRQTINRILREWSGRGWVAVGYGSLRLLQPEALHRFAFASLYEVGGSSPQ